MAFASSSLITRASIISLVVPAIMWFDCIVVCVNIDLLCSVYGPFSSFMTRVSIISLVDPAITWFDCPRWCRLFAQCSWLLLVLPWQPGHPLTAWWWQGRGLSPLATTQAQSRSVFRCVGVGPFCGNSSGNNNNVQKMKKWLILTGQY